MVAKRNSSELPVFFVLFFDLTIWLAGLSMSVQTFDAVK